MPLDLNGASSAPRQAPFCIFGIRPDPPGSSDLVLDAQGYTLDAFARQLGISLDRPIVNRTGRSASTGPVGVPDTSSSEARC